MDICQATAFMVTRADEGEITVKEFNSFLDKMIDLAEAEGFELFYTFKFMQVVEDGDLQHQGLEVSRVPNVENPEHWRRSGFRSVQ